MAITMFVIVAAISATPILAIVIVSAASRHEDRAQSLTGAPPGMTSALARRILGFRADGIWPQPKNRRAGKTATPARKTATPASPAPCGSQHRGDAAARADDQL